MASGVAEYMANWKALLKQQEQRTTTTFAEKYARMQQGLQGAIDKATHDLETVVAKGETPSQGLLHTLDTYRAFQIQSAKQYADFADYAGGVISQSQIAAAKAGANAAAGALKQEPPGLLKHPADDLVEAVQGAFDEDAVEEMAGATAGGPLGSLLQQGYGQMEQSVGQALIDGIAQGKGAMEVGTEASDKLGVGLDRMLTIARTEMNRAYRGSTLEGYRATDIVPSYMRSSARDDLVCECCLCADGDVYSSDEEPDDHPNCRCAMLPILPGETAADLGLSDSRAWFDEQSEDTQRGILGPGRLAAYQDAKAQGEVEAAALWDRIPSRHTDETWGPTLRATRIDDLKESLGGLPRGGGSTPAHELGAKSLLPYPTQAGVTTVDLFPSLKELDAFLATDAGAAAYAAEMDRVLGFEPPAGAMVMGVDDHIKAVLEKDYQSPGAVHYYLKTKGFDLSPEEKKEVMAAWKRSRGGEPPIPRDHLAGAKEVLVGKNYQSQGALQYWLDHAGSSTFNLSDEDKKALKQFWKEQRTLEPKLPKVPEPPKDPLADVKRLLAEKQYSSQGALQYFLDHQGEREFHLTSEDKAELKRLWKEDHSFSAHIGLPPEPKGPLSADLQGIVDKEMRVQLLRAEGVDQELRDRIQAAMQKAAEEQFAKGATREQLERVMAEAHTKEAALINKELKAAGKPSLKAQAMAHQFMNTKVKVAWRDDEKLLAKMRESAEAAIVRGDDPLRFMKNDYDAWVAAQTAKGAAFVPAKTYEEARKQLKDMGITVKAKEHLTDVRLPDLNAFIEGMYDEQRVAVDGQPLLIHEIGGHEEMYWQNALAECGGARGFVGINGEAMAYSMGKTAWEKNTQRANIERIRNRIEAHIAGLARGEYNLGAETREIEAYIERDKKELAKLEKKSEAGVLMFKPHNSFQYAPDSYAAAHNVAVHEMGHAWMDSQAGYRIQVTRPGFKVKGGKWGVDYVEPDKQMSLRSAIHDLFNNDTRNVYPTDYSRKNSSEWFAEAYALYRMDRGDLIDPRLREMLDSSVLRQVERSHVYEALGEGKLATDLRVIAHDIDHKAAQEFIANLELASVVDLHDEAAVSEYIAGLTNVSDLQKGAYLKAYMEKYPPGYAGPVGGWANMRSEVIAQHFPGDVRVPISKNLDGSGWIGLVKGGTRDERLFAIDKVVEIADKHGVDMRVSNTAATRGLFKGAGFVVDPKDSSVLVRYAKTEGKTFEAAGRATFRDEAGFKKWAQDSDSELARMSRAFTSDTYQGRALEYYQTEAYKVNEYLRSGASMNDAPKDIKEALTGIVYAMKDTLTDEAYSVTRVMVGVGNDGEANPAFRELVKNWDHLAGTTIVDKAILSTSMREDFRWMEEWGDQIRFHIDVPPGVHAVLGVGGGGSNGLAEMLLPPGTKLEVTRTWTENGQRHLAARVIPPKNP